jgi:hypothetical protein
MILGVVVLGAVLTTAFLVGPAPIHPLPAGYGDLTRLGWYANPLYAPARPQLEFQAVKFKVGPYEGCHDIVILGDSFSAAGWPNYLAAQGWSVAVVPPSDTASRNLDVEGLVSSAAYQVYPPKLFIYESAERELSDRFAGAPAECGAAMPSRPPLALPPAAPVQLPMHLVLPDDRVRIDARQITFARFRRREPQAPVPTQVPSRVPPGAQCAALLERAPPGAALLLQRPRDRFAQARRRRAHPLRAARHPAAGRGERDDAVPRRDRAGQALDLRP